MKVVENPDREKWNKFVAEHSSPSSFLQTWQWGEFQKTLGLKIYRLGIEGIAAQVIVRPLYLGKTYLEVTKGPVCDFNTASLERLAAELKSIAVKENAIMIRVNPPYEGDFKFSPPQADIFQKPEILLRQMEPNDTVLVDLTKSEDELLSAMHEKSRYNIRLAIKKGVKVAEKTGDKAAFEEFLNLIGETAKRDGITVWPRARFEKFREQFLLADSKSDPRAILLTGEFEGKVLAAAIVMLFGDSGTYLYAASSAENRNANVPSLVLWEAIRAAKAAGKKYYDMWGIAPAGSGEDHSWAGITRFKTRYIKVGDTGLEKHYTGTWDLVLDKKYYTLFKIGRSLRSLLK